MEKFYIDINCDVGEGVGNEEGILPLISSCNVACGGHTGNIETMTRTVLLAKEHNVLVGAHPSYPDIENFGRATMVMDSEELMLSIQNQIKGLQSVLKNEHVALHHIKAHGALYNDLAKDESLVDIYLSAIEAYKGTAHLYVPPNSVIVDKAKEKGFSVKLEAFADRNYNADLSLVSRKLPKAVIKEPVSVFGHLAQMVKKGRVITAKGVDCALHADTYCLHGDTPNALQILMYLSSELPKQQIYIKK